MSDQERWEDRWVEILNYNEKWDYRKVGGSNRQNKEERKGKARHFLCLCLTVPP